MLLTVLGCQAGVPRGGRPSSGYLVGDAAGSLLLDCGPGVATALSGRADRLVGVVVSHLHLDHVHDLLPLAKLRVAEQVRATGEVGPPIPLHVPRGAARVLDAWSALFPVPSIPALDRAITHAFDVREYAPGDRVRIGAAEVSLHPTAHAVPSCGIRVERPDGLLAYTADTGVCPGLVDLAAGADTLLAEATLDGPERSSAPHGHLCAADAARVAAVAQVGQLVLTHLPDGAAATAAARTRAAREHFTGPVLIAEPGGVLPVRP